MGANPHVVRDHDQIVELHALLDDRIVDGSAIDGRVGADLDIGPDAYGAGLRHLDPTAALLCETEAVATDYRARLDHGTRPDLHVMAYRHARCEPRVFAHGRPLFDEALRADERARSNDCTLPDHAEGADMRAGIDARSRSDHRRRVRSGRCRRERVQDGGDPRISRVRVLANQRRGRAIRRAGGVQHHRARTRRRDLLAVVRIGEKGQGVRIRARERGHAVDARIRIAAQLAAESDRELPE